MTFFFNDYREEPFEGERRILIQSPTEVATYDQKPEMSAEGGLCKAVLERLGSNGVRILDRGEFRQWRHGGSHRRVRGREDWRARWSMTAWVV